MKRITILAFLSLFGLLLKAQTKDEFLTELYDRLHDSPFQQSVKKIAPIPCGVVYVQAPEHEEKEVRAHMKLIKSLGFNALKQIMAKPGWTEERISIIALEEGIIPFWYGEGGWEPITEQLLTKLGIPKNETMEKLITNQKMIDYQKNIMKERAGKIEEYNKKNIKNLKVTSTAYEPELGKRGIDLTPKGEELFVEWCKSTYKTIENLNKAYNQDVSNLSIDDYNGFLSWEDFAARWKTLSGREFRHTRDILKFKVEHALISIGESSKKFKEIVGSTTPYRGGGEMGLFLPAAYMGVDFEGIADTIKNYGSLYPSLHFTWHYEETNHEMVLPFYQQASLMNDYFKGGWCGGWESSGGPQQISGEKDAIGNGYYVDGGTLLQFYLSQFAAGFKGFGIWCWNVRESGGEVGEYALLDRNEQVTDRAVKMGQLSKALQNLRYEIWTTKKEPIVGVLSSWNNDAMWGVVGIAGPTEFIMKPIEARIGVSRALQNANIPFEYVTPDDLKNGLGGRYKIIYMPAMMCIENELQKSLKTYVEEGGRLVMDAPGGWINEYGDLITSEKGSFIEQVFGTQLSDVQFSGTNRSFSIDANSINGFMYDLNLTTAKSNYNYSHGKPAITENKLGKGTAIIIGYNASLDCFKKGNIESEKRLLKYTMGNYPSPYSCDGAIVYRLASPTADYYIFINEGEQKKVNLKTKFTYKKITDPISGEILTNAEGINLETHSARWLRMEK